MATFWTLTYNGTEQSFQDWGFTDPRMQLRSQARSTFTVRIPGATNLVNAPPIPFEGQVIICRGRASGSGGYSGGSIVFQGRQVTDRKIASQNPADMLTFADAWYDLESTPFCQQWKSTVDGVTYSTVPFARYNLFQALSGALQTNGAQLVEILNWAIGGGAVLQVGSIGSLDMNWYLPPYPARGLMCSAAILLCLRPTPDALTWIDYTTTPPTFHCQQRSNLTALALPYADGTKHRSSDIVARYDLVPSQVVLQYQKSIQVNNESFTELATDVYPAGSNGQALRAIVVPIDLRGFSRTDLIVKVSAVGPLDPTSLAWWTQKKPELAKVNDLAMVAGSVKILSASGVDITGAALVAWPNEYTKGEIANWMKDGGGNAIVATPVTISAQFTYNEFDPNNIKVHSITEANPHTVSTRVKLTNSAPGDVYYDALQSEDMGETMILGLAEQIYNMLQPLQHEGTHVIVEQVAGVPTVGTIVGPQYALNLTGGAAEWAEMAATIQETEIEFFRGQTEVRFGPAKHIAPGDLEEILQFYRWRIKFDALGLRGSGQDLSSSTNLGGDTSQENTTHANPIPALHSTCALQTDATGGTTFVQHDAAGESISLQRLDGSGNPITAAGSVAMALSKAEGQALTIGRVHYTDDLDSTKKRCLMLHSIPQSDTVDDGGNSIPNDIWLGGGTGVACQIMVVMSFDAGGAYMNCVPWDPTTPWTSAQAGAATVQVAKPFNLQCTLASEVVDGVTLSYAYPGIAGLDPNNHRAASDPTLNSEAQVMFPRYTAYVPGSGSTPNAPAAESLIVAIQPANGTGIGSVSWLEIKPARVWCRAYNQTTGT